jgi:hypothetical protein
MNQRWRQGISGGLAAFALAVLLCAPAGASPPLAHAAGSCSLAGKYRSLGPTYVERLSVSRTSCSTGTKLIKSYNACRLRSGGAKGRCRSKVLGFRCSEKRSSSSVQFVATVHCTSGSKTVNFAYSENTA